MDNLIFENKKKIICDLVYGYVEICNLTEKIINNESFQRLRDIKQMTSFHLYPSANHTRFEHSLGVMHLSLQFYHRIKKQIKNIYKIEYVNSTEIIETKMKILLFHLQYAALLHDVGHAPLSHLGEKFYKKDEIKQNIKDELSKKNISIDEKAFIKGSEHEWMSCLVIIINFYETIQDISHDFDTEFDIEFVIRIITGNLYADSEQSKFWDYDLMIQIVNSDSIDVDKLDYLMRDNHMTGKIGPELDLKRLIESLIITKNKNLSFSKVGLSTIQKIIDCRDQIYLWICNHHTVAYTDFLYEELLKHVTKLYKSDIPPLFINDKRIKEEYRDEILSYYTLINENYRLNKIDEGKKDTLVKKLNQIGYLPYDEAMDSSEYFSIDAIVDYKVTDSDIHSFIRGLKASSLSSEPSLYTKKLLSQLLNRHFLKPLWKTIFDYKKFIEDNISSDVHHGIVDYLSHKTLGENNRRKLVKVILQETNQMPGDVMLIIRQNKFYLPTDIDHFYISLDEKSNKSLSDLLPQKDYNKKFSRIAFYVFCQDDKKIKEKVKDSLINNLNLYRSIDEKYKEYFG